MNRMFFYKQQNFKSPKFVPHIYIIYILNKLYYRRERILENRAKAMRVAARQAELKARRERSGLVNSEGDTMAGDIENAEKMFFDTVRRIKMEREQKTVFSVKI